MTDQPIVPPIPSFVTTLTHSLAQKAFTALATFLIGNGLIQSSQQSELVQTGVGVALFALSIGWTWLRTKIDTDRSKALVVQAQTK